MSKHQIYHIELSTKDRRKDADFYNKLFGWEFTQFDEMNYATFTTGGEQGTGGGLNPVGDQYPAGTVPRIHQDHRAVTPHHLDMTVPPCQDRRPDPGQHLRKLLIRCGRRDHFSVGARGAMKTE